MTTESMVFIVDDDAAFRESLSVLVRSVGLKSKEYSSAAEFLQAFTPNAPGCLILDVRMPGISGLELQERLSKEPGCPSILVLTGSAEVPAALRAIRQGAVEYLQKTCGETELLEAIHRALAKDAENRRVQARREEIFFLLVSPC